MSCRTLVIDIETLPGLVETFSLRNDYISPDWVVEETRVLCFAAQWFGEKDIQFFAEWDSGGRSKMITAAWALFNEADFIVTYNGRRFDIPHLNYEFLKEGLTPPAPYKDIDLYQTVRTSFNAMSHKLDWYAQKVLDKKKEETGGMALWQTFRRPASDKALKAAQKKMATYNRGDVRITTDLFTVLRPWIKGMNITTYTDAKDICTKCGSDELEKRGTHSANVTIYQRYRCKACGSWLRSAKALWTSKELRPV